tara:strand:- start:506 stop:784 length:279 start_codon:yes stop_codon:yes gene_type:complete
MIGIQAKHKRKASNMNVIDTLATEMIKGNIGIAKASIDLMTLSDISYSQCKILLAKSRKRLINIQMQRELVEEDEEFNDLRFEAEYRQGVSA